MVGVREVNVGGTRFLTFVGSVVEFSRNFNSSSAASIKPCMAVTTTIYLL